METMSLNYTVLQRYIMPIFTCNFPVHLSKYVLELFMWEQSGHHCLLRVIAKALKHVE